MVGRTKASDIQRLYPEAVIIGADTIVAIDGKCLGKPKDKGRSGLNASIIVRKDTSSLDGCHDSVRE